MADVKLVRLAELYLYANQDDWSYGHLMRDPRSREIGESEAVPLWTENDMAPGPTWQAGMKGLPSSAWASLHCYQHGLDFDFLDIGANLGIQGLAQATLHKRCGWSKKVYLFEPGEIAVLLEQSVARNRISDIATVVHAAATDRAGTETFYFLPKASGGSSLLARKVFDPEIKTDVKTTTVQGVTIDDFVRQHVRKTPALIVKIDTEGADFKVLEGMRETMRERLVIAQIEFIPHLVESYASPAARLAELAREFVLVNVGHGEQRSIIASGGLDSFVEEARRALHPPDIFLIPRRLPHSATLLETILTS